ncbi:MULTISPECIES: tannase/feruloyl esterase family alpha/beta hydrolase [unclassified Delftia]|uniref:tannase/feruloyl esterase family alpha/beta hydrolase n=1 Tax=unclassified Delftia TaxID=2613839 RepID=UPI0019016F05|nr:MULTISPECIES: tannase/feruloyl esterase family alpha/beta hydrolase [unclassified Delftia]MBK0114058.1 tannase/feruloyl esterase family alpha/beta hydrolase [Delftia sp. S65]MBK0117866.1 tannase/feruloyl esterase family alpha/beta hydrolase [Delftia sp. S67]MBK0129135.1 tannase/feruloyl esterase family alpha/beta hydrolase [Delftia sp. S66]
MDIGITLNRRDVTLGASIGVGICLALSACGGSGTPDTIEVTQATKCTQLENTTLPASAIGLPTRGAVVQSATLQAASAQNGTPEFCKVVGSVLSASDADPAIQFQVNLPTRWNLKALQFGGGGLNGSVITAIGQFTHGPAVGPTPLAQGYATFGSDSGHQAGPLDGSFGLNAQALANYAGESVKRTHDAAALLMQRYYERPARRMYHIGGSKGGHEGLVAAQRYASDYDGVVAYYPAAQNPLLVLAWNRMWRSVYGSSTSGAELNDEKKQLLKARTLAACDRLDGAEDGIIANTAMCQAKFDVGTLRCASGADEGNFCLSDVQLAPLRLASSVIEMEVPMANGYRSVGPFPVLQGADPTGSLYDSPALRPVLGLGKATSYFYLPDPVIRMWYMQAPQSSLAQFDARQHRARIQQLSQAYDGSNPDLDAFKSRSGKLILVQGSTDMQVPEPATSAYYDTVAQRYGAARRDFVRYYVQPGFAHGGGDFALTWDALTALDRWVDAGAAPADQIATDSNANTAGRTRPLCEYPLFPKYRGSGDLSSASSFSCAAQ